VADLVGKAWGGDRGGRGRERGHRGLRWKVSQMSLRPNAEAVNFVAALFLLRKGVKQ